MLGVYAFTGRMQSTEQAEDGAVGGTYKQVWLPDGRVIRNFKSLSVVLVVPWSPRLPAGVSVVVHNLDKRMRSEEFRTTTIVSSWRASRLAVDADGTLAFRFSLLAIAGRMGWIKSILRAPVRLFRTHVVLHQTGADAVNFHYPSLDALGVAILKRLRLFRGSLVLSFHGTDVRVPASAIEKRLWRFTLSTADRLSACSGWLAALVAETFEISRDRVTVIYNGVEQASLDLGKGTGLGGLPERYLLSVGSYIPLKGHRILLEAFARTSRDFPDVDLVIAGADGPERNVLTQRAEELGVSRRFYCLVALSPSEVASLLGRAQACVQPSYVESFGLVIIEAGALGVPIVASAVGGHSELLRDRETAFLFAAGDIQACELALRVVLTERDLAETVARRFQAEVLERFTWEKCVGAYRELNGVAARQTS